MGKMNNTVKNQHHTQPEAIAGLADNGIDEEGPSKFTTVASRIALITNKQSSGNGRLSSHENSGNKVNMINSYAKTSNGLRTSNLRQQN